MRLLLGLLKPLQVFNDAAGRLGRSISVIALSLMVGVILLQVFCRYVLNNALPWPDEAARFCMLWLTGLMAPVALRQGGFVAIDTLSTFLPRRGIAILAIILFVISLLVLTVAVELGWNHVNTGFLFTSASLKLPLHLIGLKAVKIKLAWMYMSLFTSSCLMILVNVEMIIRQIVILVRQEHHLRPIPILDEQGAK
jgi:TRAP-type C4-dicarboxylate transport system permease small subunit